MLKTDYLQLKKPELTDLADINVINDNMDIIDEGCFDNDNYYRYVKISMLNKILLSIKSMI